MTEIPLFLDFEASSLEAASYPIQVAWSDAAGQIESWYLNPYCVDDWTDWDFHAQQAVHGISRAFLREEGKHPRFVAERMNAALAWQTAYVTGWDFDRMWCARLLVAAGLEATFELGNYWQLFPDEYLQFGEDGRQHIESLAEEAWRRTPGRRHDAAVDVLQMIELYRMVVEQSKPGGR